MKPLSISFSMMIAVILVGCGGEEQTNQEVTTKKKQASQRYDELLSDKLSVFTPLPAKAENPDNLSNDAKIELGHMLYYDTRLSKDGNNSCNSCHDLKRYGVDHLPTSPGDLGKSGSRNSPTTLNAALHFKQFWDGRAADVEEQAGGPVLNPVEMNMPDEKAVVSRLKQVEIYEDLFSQAFPQSKEPITYSNIQKAIGSFERQLLTPSRFDEYLKGNKDALSLREKKGLLSFSLVGCTTCHNGPLLGGNQFQRFGVHKDYWDATGSKEIDRGLAQETNDDMDLYMFKVPSLRNITETHPYFHDGSISSLKESIQIMAEVQLDYRLNKDEVQNITAFMESLKGEVPAQYQKNPLETTE